MRARQDPHRGPACHRLGRYSPLRWSDKRHALPGLRQDTLVPVLKRGDTVSLDNLGAHKVAGVREAIAAGGARLLPLPPDSPEPKDRVSDFNPLEQAFAKLKALLRSAAARTVPDLWTAIRHAFAAFRPDEGRNYLTAADHDA